MTAAEDTAGAAAEVVQKAAAPVAFIAVVVGACLAVTVLIRRFGSSLPLPDYLVEFVQADDDDEERDDEEEPAREQW